MLKLFQFKKHSNRERRGATAVEFAMVVPIFALFCAALLDFSRISLARNALHTAVYRGGRLAMTEGVTREETVEAVEDYLAILGFEPAENSIVAGQIYLSDSGMALPVNTTNEFDSDSVEYHVEAAIPFSSASLLFTNFIPSWVEDREIRSEIRIQSERYNGFFNPAEAYAN